MRRQARRTGGDVFGGRFSRGGALPPSVVHLLQDAGSVLDLFGTSPRATS